MRKCRKIICIFFTWCTFIYRNEKNPVQTGENINGYTEVVIALGNVRRWLGSEAEIFA